MNQPYIREFESESDYQLSLVFDARSDMGAGPTGRTKLHYAREVALGCVYAAESYGDPVSAQLVDDGGTIWRYGPSASSTAYRTIRSRLLDVDPAAKRRRDTDRSRPISPAEAGTRGGILDDDSPFASRLRPFLADTTSYVSRVSDRPLFSAVSAACSDADRRHHLVLVTDDTAKVETYEAAVLASKQSGRTSVFLTPTALFERGGTASGDGFVEFEEFRARLDRLENVTAYEVAPRTAVELATTSVATALGES
jgi:uncharacterized protein (DUF58 family)